MQGPSIPPTSHLIVQFFFHSLITLCNHWTYLNMWHCLVLLGIPNKTPRTQKSWNFFFFFWWIFQKVFCLFKTSRSLQPRNRNSSPATSGSQCYSAYQVSLAVTFVRSRLQSLWRTAWWNPAERFVTRIDETLMFWVVLSFIYFFSQPL